jgi:glycosyltransferase involved in cell wall biosynthesis
LRQLAEGRTHFAGSVTRLRILFWLAARGHEVALAGNVEPGRWQGVCALASEAGLHSALEQDGSEPQWLILNDPPAAEKWDWLRQFRNDHRRFLLWAGNPLDWVWLERAAAGALDRIVCVSHAHREFYRLYPGFEALEMVYTGVDNDLIAAAPALPAASGPVVLSVSVPRRTKGIHHLLAAWREVRREAPGAHLRICGSARMHAPDAMLGPTGILDAAVEAEFPDIFGDHPRSTERAGVELAGVLPLPEMYANLKAATIAVVNSNWRSGIETYCRSAVEAQVAGVPVVGAARGALPEVVAHGVTGLLVDKEDPAALADAIVALLKDDGLRRRMGAAGPAWAQQFTDYERIADAWEAVARRAWRRERPPVESRFWPDAVRRLGYGRARLWLRSRLKGR